MEASGVVADTGDTGATAFPSPSIPARWGETFGYTQSTGHHAIWLPSCPLRTAQDVLSWFDEETERGTWIDQFPTFWAPWQDDLRALESVMIINPVWKDAPFRQALPFGAMKGALLWLADRGLVANDKLIPNFQSRLELLQFSESLRGKLATLASMTLDEARELAKRAKRFKDEKGRLPSLTALDPWEKRMAEGIAFLQRKVKESGNA